MADATSTDAYRLKDRVVAAHDLTGVPQGTQGRVTMVTGLSWTRYRVRFDNGVELGSLDARHLAPPPGRS